MKTEAPPSTLPEGLAPDPVPFPHFPGRLHAFVFRNWNLLPAEKLADVLGTTADEVTALAGSMGLPTRPEPAVFARNGYITLLRRNWHLLPYEQLMELVDMTEEELAFALLEDDFLFIKFGRLKPRCAPLRWAEPTESENLRAAEIKALLEHHLGDLLHAKGEDRFAFIKPWDRLDPRMPESRPLPSPTDPPRFIYSHCGLFGDPLMDDQLSSYPAGLLQQLAARGVNGIWLHTVLRTLAPGGEAFPEFGHGHEQRLQNLRRLVERAGRHGIGVYLYINEPRGMPHAFFEKHPDVAGVSKGEVTAMCTEVPKVRKWLTTGLTHVFTEVPELAGVFTITASENLTSCASHRGQDDCPRCCQRGYEAIIADVNGLIEQAVHAGNPDARVIAWDWGWHWHADASGIIPRLPENTWLMSVSEWGQPIERGGVESTVGEYSLSAPGPGPRATRHWSVAREHGLKTVAKVQLNATWELASLPYLPVPDLVAEHCAGLAQAGIDGLMLSWSLGGYPSPNLEIAQQLARNPDTDRDTVLDALARKTYGPEGAPHARAAWTTFSEAFREYPFHIRVVYNAPVQLGPANLLYPEPTGFRATMLGFPYDDLETWRGPYPPETFAGQFAKMAAGWSRGLPKLEEAVRLAPPETRAGALDELRFARTAALIFRSVANQVRFVQLRESDDKEALLSLLDNEIAAAASLYALCLEDSRIGFEAANQYFFVPGDLLEKIINCEHLKARIVREAH